MKIKMSEPNGPYSCEVDSGAMQVELREVFIGVGFVCESGERLAVSMRDDGFEILYSGDFGEKGFSFRPIELQGGQITMGGRPLG